MDLNNRVDAMDEELKLLKNEIKQILLDIQEHVLSVENPFSGPSVFAAAPAARQPGVSLDVEKPKPKEEKKKTAKVEDKKAEEVVEDEPELEPEDEMEEVVAKEERDSEVKDREPGAKMEEPAETATPEKEMFKRKELNLITIASLAQWADRVINRIGSEHFGTLVELSAMTKRISPEVKEVLLILVPLLEGRESGSGLAAKDLVALIAQLGML